MGERIRRVKVRKLLGWDKDSLMGKTEAVQKSKAKQGIQVLLPISRQVLTIPRKAGLHRAQHLLWKTNAITPNIPLSPSFYWWAWHHMLWDIPLVSWGHLFQLGLLPISCAPPAYSLAGHCEKQKRPWHNVSAVQQQLKHPCVINTVLDTNPKHSTIQATRKKINSSLAKTGTKVLGWEVFFHSFSSQVLFLCFVFFFLLHKVLHKGTCIIYT